MEWNTALWRRHVGELTDFLGPAVKGLGRSERRTGAARYVQGLLLPGGRKSIEPLAERNRYAQPPAWVVPSLRLGRDVSIDKSEREWSR